MRTTTVLTAVFLATLLLTTQARPSDELIRTKRQAGTMNCLLYGICGKPRDYRSWKIDKRYGPWYHNKFYHRRGIGHFTYGIH